VTKGQFRVRRCGLDGVEAVEARTRHAFPRHIHEQFGVGVVDDGGQVSRSGRGMVEAVAGDTITVNPGEVHDGAPIGEGGRAWRMLYFNPSLIAAAADEVRPGGRLEFQLPVVRTLRVARRFRALFAAMTTESEGGEEHLLMLLADLMREQGGLAPEASVPQALAIARRRIDDDPTAAVTLADLATESGLSRFQVLRGFARTTGLTPHAYLVQRRIAMARRMIAGGSRLADAALESGFADQSHMTRTFVRNYGLSPGAYAQALA